MANNDLNMLVRDIQRSGNPQEAYKELSEPTLPSADLVSARLDNFSTSLWEGLSEMTPDLSNFAPYFGSQRQSYVRTLHQAVFSDEKFLTSLRSAFPVGTVAAYFAEAGVWTLGNGAYLIGKPFAVDGPAILAEGLYEMTSAQNKMEFMGGVGQLGKGLFVEALAVTGLLSFLQGPFIASLSMPGNFIRNGSSIIGTLSNTRILSPALATGIAEIGAVGFLATAKSGVTGGNGKAKKPAPVKAKTNRKKFTSSEQWAKRLRTELEKVPMDKLPKGVSRADVLELKQELGRLDDLVKKGGDSSSTLGRIAKSDAFRELAEAARKDLSFKEIASLRDSLLDTLRVQGQRLSGAPSYIGHSIETR